MDTGIGSHKSQTRVSHEQFREHLREAKKKYPLDDYQTALRKHVRREGEQGLWRNRGIFFYGPDDDRQIWEEGISTIARKDVRNGGETVLSDCGRSFIINESRKEKLYGKNPYIFLLRHQSERQWILPQGHGRHFLSFPREIRELIYSFALTTQKHGYLAPNTVSTNWKREYKRPYHDIQGRKVIVWTTVSALRKDAEGYYTEFRDVYRPLIDATLLRVSKQLYAEGSSILYGNNEFRFSGMSSISLSQCHPNFDTDEAFAYAVYHPSPSQPLVNPREWEISELGTWDEQVAAGFSLMNNESRPRELPGWMYYDPFLRFLHSVGPTNAALLTNLEIWGEIDSHQYYRECRCNRNNCISKSLLLYLPFIAKFCTGLRMLTITVYRGYRRRANDIQEIETLLRPILDSQIPNITALRELVVRDGRGEELEFAREAVRQVDRTACERCKAIREEEHIGAGSAIFELAIAELAIVNVETATIDPLCAFCGEDHIWAECYNLCNFCGRYGHLGGHCDEK